MSYRKTRCLGSVRAFRKEEEYWVINSKIQISNNLLDRCNTRGELSSVGVGPKRERKTSSKKVACLSSKFEIKGGTGGLKKPASLRCSLRGGRWGAWNRIRKKNHSETPYGALRGPLSKEESIRGLQMEKKYLSERRTLSNINSEEGGLRKRGDLYCVSGGRRFKNLTLKGTRRGSVILSNALD